MMAPHLQHDEPTRLLILGGGFGGVYAAQRLERLIGQDRRVDITLVSRDNYFLMTPLLFEAGSGVLEPRHAVSPIRRLFDHVRFIEADIERIDLQQQMVFGRHARGGHAYELPYDHLVLALGGVTNRRVIPGSEHALGFKSLADAIYLRNHLIDLLEQADVERDPERKRAMLSFVIIGGGLVGVELMGELTEFIPQLARSYPRVKKEDLRFYLIEAAPKVLPEMDRDLADYAAETLRRRGVQIEIDMRVDRLEPEAAHLPDGRALAAHTIVLAAGVAANPLLHDLPVPKNRQGKVETEPTLRVQGFANVWAVGDCASIPDPAGKPYPPLAQHALREARVLADNLVKTVRGHGRLEPFVYEQLGTLASLGHYSGVGRILQWKVRGFLAWWIWRTYYLAQMPRLERKLRVVLDWTIALLFRNDIVKLDLFGVEHPRLQAIEQAQRNASATEAAEVIDGGLPQVRPSSPGEAPPAAPAASTAPHDAR